MTKYNSIGELVWQETYAGTAAQNDHGIAVTTNTSGDVFVAATVNNTGNDLDFAVLKYSSAGSLIRDASWNGPSDLADVPSGLMLDTAGNIYLYGGSWTDPLFADMALVKFDPTGTEQWSITYDQASLLDAAIGVQFDQDGNPIVFGVSASSAFQWDVIGHWGRASSSVGASTWTSRGLTEANYTFDVTGNYVVVTTTTNSWYIINSIDNSIIVNDWYPALPDQLRTAYSLHVRNADCWGVSTVTVEEVDAPSVFSLYPNPTNDLLHIALGETMGSGWELTLVDALGRTIYSEPASQRQLLSIPVAHLPVGTYCAILRRESEIHARRSIKFS